MFRLLIDPSLAWLLTGFLAVPIAGFLDSTEIPSVLPGLCPWGFQCRTQGITPQLGAPSILCTLWAEGTRGASLDIASPAAEPTGAARNHWVPTHHLWPQGL